MTLRRVFVFYIWRGFVENKDPAVSYTSKVEIPVSSYS